MEEIIKTFHIDWKLLIAQAVNFAIVVFALYKFAYKPLLKTMNERTAKIEQGLKDAELSQEKLAEAETRKKEEIIKAKKEAKKIIEEAMEQANENQEKIVANAKERAEKVTVEAKEQIQQEKEKMLLEVRQEIGELVLLTTEKIIDEKIKKDGDQEIIANSIKALS
ncbi:MAG TPA: F0F1 ATP synthase subunit B [Candidatus Moranbacteria bacterium]|nr:F0F1 ATP synthase subunit B [Candidatus Moranbacteria bacterium]